MDSCSRNGRDEGCFCGVGGVGSGLTMHYLVSAQAQFGFVNKMFVFSSSSEIENLSEKKTRIST